MFNTIKTKTHDDLQDKKVISGKVLRKTIPELTQVVNISKAKYHPFDLIAITEKEIIPIQLKNKMNYSINQFSDVEIDTTAYDDIIKQNGYLFVIYPKDKKLLIYDAKSLKDNYLGIHKDVKVKSFFEKTKKWYYQTKDLARVFINKSHIFDFAYFNIEDDEFEE